MQSILGFIVLILFVVLVAAFGMWAAQGIGSRMGRKGARDPGNRAAGLPSGESALTHHPSPNGRYEVITAANEVRTGRWVESPSLHDLEDLTEWFALDNRWSADVITWSADSLAVTIKLRKYPGDVPGVALFADLIGAQARFITRNGTESVPLSEVEQWLESYIRRFGNARA